MRTTTTSHTRRALTGTRIVIVAVSAATGACFAALAGLSIAAMIMPFRRFHVLSLIFAVISLWVGYMAFRAARVGHTDKVTRRQSLVRGMIGAMVGVLAMFALLLLFRPDAQSTLAHAFGRPSWSFTVNRLLIVSALLGFGAGFVARIRIAAK